MLYERVAETALTMLDTRLIYIGDRESDIVAMMRRARDMGHPADWLVRSQQNRTLLGGGKLWAQVTTGEAWGEIEFSLANAARPNGTPRSPVRLGACHGNPG